LVARSDRYKLSHPFALTLENYKTPADMLFQNQHLKSIRCLQDFRQLFRYRQLCRPEILVSATKKLIFRKRGRQKIIHFAVIIAIVIMASLSGVTKSRAKNLVSPKYRGIIVLDPGHGGNDIGAQNSDGIQEKAVTLRLARMITEKISDDFKVVLTRTDDFWVDLPDRTAVANNLKADILISLHAGGGFLHSVGGMAVFYYDRYSDSTLQAKEPAFDPLKDSDAPIPWIRIQEKYRARSQKLAELIQSELFRITQDPGGGTRGAPLVVLKGADMPAVLIELGYLTHPNESKALVDENFLALITDAIINAIEKFLSKRKN
jgi:N-acetylmuramoyl-L-alanine amidase